uniref:U3 small nucleolar RNA-associated protein 7 n=1 Tax=Rhabditophanes sp. KR3021 TaxID=114890 RepID=A0AC35TG57_9BILA
MKVSPTEDITKLLVTGGLDSEKSVYSINLADWKVTQLGDLLEGSLSKCVEKFNTETNEREILPFEFPELLNGVSSAVIDNKVYAIGGKIEGGAIFESEKFEWIQLPKLKHNVSHHKSFVVGNVIYVTPGHGPMVMQRIDPRQRKTAVLAQMEGTSRLCTFAKCDDCIMGCGGTTQTQVYDIEVDEWRKMSQLKRTFGGDCFGTLTHMYYFPVFAKDLITRNIAYRFNIKREQWKEFNIHIPPLDYKNDGYSFITV